MPSRPPTLTLRAGPLAPDGRPAPGRRGYGRSWRRVRRAKLADQPLCEHCLLAGSETPAEEVDHKDRDTSNNTPANLQSLCKPCHSRKTVAEDGGLGRPKRHP